MERPRGGRVDAEHDDPALVIGHEQERISAIECCGLCVENDVDAPKLRCGHPLPCPRHEQIGRCDCWVCRGMRGEGE